MLFEHILPALRAGRTIRRANMPPGHGLKWGTLPDGRAALIRLTPMGETNYVMNEREIVLMDDWEVTNDGAAQGKQGQA
jgi:hypothetical protein